VLPGALVLLALSWLLAAGRDLPAVAAVFDGLKPVVVAIVAHAALRIGRRALASWQAWALAAAAFVALFALRIDFPWVVLGAGLAGWIAGRGGASPFVGAKSHGDGAPLPEAPAPGGFWRRLAIVAVAYVVLLAIPVAACVHVLGSEPFLGIAVLFTKAAFVTFGGAYAVLPYVYQASVEQFGWLTPTQMIDGLALGETTPGPLIMIVAFVGFVGAWTQQVFGESVFLAGCVGAAVATWFTFLPSFLFIFAGAPLIEGTHGKLAFTAPLTAITAAVVGVIVNLALFFAWHVFWPEGFSGPVEWFAMLIGVAAFIALLRYKAGVVSVIGACAAAGLAWTLLL
jgi:chromate transporter